MFNQGNSQIFSGSSSQATGSNSSKAAASGSLSKDFIKALQGQMADWVTAISDTKITSAEVSTIQSGEDLNALSESPDAEALYDGSAAYLYASIQINDITNIMTFLFTYQSKQNELYEKAGQLLRA